MIPTTINPTRPGLPKPAQRRTMVLVVAAILMALAAAIAQPVMSVAAAASTQPGLSVGSDVVVGEGDGYVDLPIQLNAPGTLPVTVSYASADGTASGCSCYSNYEFNSVSGTVTFEPGQTLQTVRVNLYDNTKLTTLNYFTFNLSGPINATLVRGHQTVDIVPNGVQVATPGLFVRDALVDSEAGSVQVPVMLGGGGDYDQASNSAVTVDYATSDMSALAGTDYTATSGTLTFAPGQTVENITVPVLHDAAAVPDRRFAVSLSNPSNATVADGTGVVTIGASGQAASTQPGLSVGSDVVVGEGDGYVDLPIQLNAPGTLPVTVSYASADGTASGCSCYSNYEFNSVSGTVTFEPGQTLQTVRVNLYDNTKLTTLNYFTFNLSGPINATLVRGHQTVDIVPNGVQVATPGLFVRDALVDSEAGSVQVPVMLGGGGDYDQASNSAVTVDYATSDMSALAGTDYTATSGTLTFAPGQTVENITVPVLHDAAAVPDRRFAVSLSNPSNATVADGTGVVTIGASGQAASTQPGLSVGSDVVVGEGDGYVDLPIQLNAPGTLPVTVSYASADGTASGCSCYSNYEFNSVSGTVTFEPGQTLQTVRVNLYDNTKLTTLNYFTFNLSGPINATLVRGHQTVDIVPNGVQVATPGLFVRDALVDSEAGSVQVPVMLGGGGDYDQASNSAVTVDYATSDMSALAGTDYTATSGTLTFAPGQTVENITVPVLHDAAAVPDRRFAVSLSNPSNATVADGTGVVTIGASGQAASTQPGLSVGSDVVVGEGDGYVDLPIQLNAPGTLPVTVSYASADGTASGCSCYSNYEFNSVSGTVTFEPGQTLQTVRVNLYDNTKLTTLNYFTFNLSGPINATLVRGHQTVDIVPVSFVANATESTVATSQPSVPANGVAQSTITVTLENGSGVVLPGRIVTLVGSASSQSAISPASVSTDDNGQASFEVSDTTVEPVTYTADDSTDGLSLSQTATVSFVRPPTGGGEVPLSPTRLLDTRNGTGEILGPVGAGSVVSLQVLDRGGVPPSGVAAVVLNVAVTAPTAAGFLTVYPDGVPRPNTANLNFTAGETVPNLVVAPVGADGKVDFYNSAGSVQIIADVSGWFASGSPGAGGLGALTPARVLDTRNGTGGITGPVGAGQPIGLSVLGQGGIPPSGVAAVVLNVAVTAATAAGFVTVYPDGVTRPNTANLNFTAGETVPNLVVAPVGTDGKVDFYNNAGSVQIIADVSGWFASGSPGAGGLGALTPARLLDTRKGTGGTTGPVGAGQSIRLSVLGQGGIPASGVAAVVLNVAVTAPTAAGFLTVYPDGVPRPNTANLNFTAGETVPNLVVAPVGTDGKVDFYNSAGSVQIIADVSGWFGS